MDGLVVLPATITGPSMEDCSILAAEASYQTSLSSQVTPTVGEKSGGSSVVESQTASSGVASAMKAPTNCNPSGSSGSRK